MRQRPGSRVSIAGTDARQILRLERFLRSTEAVKTVHVQDGVPGGVVDGYGGRSRVTNKSGRLTWTVGQPCRILTYYSPNAMVERGPGPASPYMDTDMEEALLAAVSFAALIGILITVHELGHYLAARATGVAVHEFAVGFGPVMLSHAAADGTRWNLRAIPLGGFVRMQGMDVGSDEGLPSGDFWRKSLLSRVAVIAGGPLANVLFAIVLLSALAATAGRPLHYRSVISYVTPGGAADRLGLRAGDFIVGVDGRRMADTGPVDAALGLVDDKDALTLQVERKSGTAVISFPADASRLDVGFLTGTDTLRERLPIASAISWGFRKTGTGLGVVVKGIGALVAGNAPAGGHLSGPVGIAVMAGQTAHAGFAALVTLMAALSINLCMLNMMPIPVLDGGRLLFFAFEAIRGRPLSDRFQRIGMNASLALLGTFFFWTTANDIVGSGVISWLGGYLR